MAENQGTKGNQTQRNHIEDPLWVRYDFEVYSSVGLLGVKMWT